MKEDTRKPWQRKRVQTLAVTALSTTLSAVMGLVAWPVAIAAIAAVSVAYVTGQSYSDGKEAEARGAVAVAEVQAQTTERLAAGRLPSA